MPPAVVSAVESHYIDFDREQWARLRANHPLHLSASEVQRLRGLGDRVDLHEVEEVYLPLSRLLTFHVDAMRGLHRVTSDFLGEHPPKTPFVIGVSGSVAVGKSTTARLLAELLRRWRRRPDVRLLTTDGFLYSNAELERRGLLIRKGFPESYDRRALLDLVAAVKAGREDVTAPVYSHLHYDIIPDQRIPVGRPDILIVEGLNVLQPPPAAGLLEGRVAVSDYFDFSVYVDAAVSDLRRWYVDRFMRLRETAFADPDSYFHRYASLSETDARRTATSLWTTINEPNLIENIAPTKGRATLVLTKGSDHAVSRIRLRKL